MGCFLPCSDFFFKCPGSDVLVERSCDKCDSVSSWIFQRRIWWNQVEWLKNIVVFQSVVGLWFCPWKRRLCGGQFLDEELYPPSDAFFVCHTHNFLVVLIRVKNAVNSSSFHALDGSLALATISVAISGRTSGHAPQHRGHKIHLVKLALSGEEPRTNTFQMWQTVGLRWSDALPQMGNKRNCYSDVPTR